MLFRSAVQMIAEHLRLDRCYVGIALLDDNRGIFPYQSGNDRVMPLPEDGVSLSDFPEALRKTFDETLVITDFQGHTRRTRDAYSFWPSLGETDLYLFGQGNERRIYDKLGAQLRAVDGVPGVSFAVWAPSAKRVKIGRAHV